MKTMRKFLNKKPMGLMLAGTLFFSSMVGYADICVTVTVTTKTCTIDAGGVKMCSTTEVTTTTCTSNPVGNLVGPGNLSVPPIERVVPVTVDVSFLQTVGERGIVELVNPVVATFNNINYLIPQGEYRVGADMLIHARAHRMN